MAAIAAAYHSLFDVEAQKPQATTSALHTEEPGSRRRACPQKNSSQGKKRRHRTDACVEVGEDVFRFPPVLDEQTCRAAVNEVDDRVALGLSPPVLKSKFYGAFVLNLRVDLHAIDATPARRRGDVGSSPLERSQRGHVVAEK